MDCWFCSHAFERWRRQSYSCVTSGKSVVAYGESVTIVFVLHYVFYAKKWLCTCLNRESCWGATDDFTVSSVFPCSPLPSGTWRTPGLSIPWCCLPTASSVCLVFFPLSLCLARWFLPDLMNGRHDHTTAVCVSLRWSGLRVVRLLAGSWHGLPRW